MLKSQNWWQTWLVTVSAMFSHLFVKLPEKSLRAAFMFLTFFGRERAQTEPIAQNATPTTSIAMSVQGSFLKITCGTQGLGQGDQELPEFHPTSESLLPTSKKRIKHGLYRSCESSDWWMNLCLKLQQISPPFQKRFLQWGRFGEDVLLPPMALDEARSDSKNGCWVDTKGGHAEHHRPSPVLPSPGIMVNTCLYRKSSPNVLNSRL